MPIVYFFLLILYIVKKESDRWLDIKWKKRKGEIYLVLWFVVTGVMFIIEWFTSGYYLVPGRLIETLIWIIVAYAGAMVSIIVHHLINSETVISLLKLYLKERQRSELITVKPVHRKEGVE
ncbi:hypothetical protein IID19_00010 [Patescibacteria group bacterium]|nr:hypothetical protein [Patescibacteria group bacterium]